MTDKYERSAYGDIWSVIQILKHESIITGSNIIEIQSRVFGYGNFEKGKKILRRLVNVDKVIKILSTSAQYAMFIIDRQSGNSKLKIELLDKKFDQFADEIERKYKGMATEYQTSQAVVIQKPKIEAEQKESNFRYDSEGAMLFYNDELVLNMHKNNSGRAKIFNALWDGKKTILDKVTVEKGKPAILRSELCRISEYTSNENIDKAIAFFRKKLNGLPLKIVAEKGFRLIIND